MTPRCFSALSLLILWLLPLPALGGESSNNEDVVDHNIGLGAEQVRVDFFAPMQSITVDLNVTAGDCLSDYLGLETALERAIDESGIPIRLYPTRASIFFPKLTFSVNATRRPDGSCLGIFSYDLTYTDSTRIELSGADKAIVATMYGKPYSYRAPIHGDTIDAALQEQMKYVDKNLAGVWSLAREARDKEPLRSILGSSCSNRPNNVMCIDWLRLQAETNDSE